MAEALSDAFVWRLSVCLSRTSGVTREQRGLGRKTKIGTDSPRHTWLGHHFQGQKVNFADVLNSQHAGTGATWRINAKILSTCRGRRYFVSPQYTHSLFCLSASTSTSLLHYEYSALKTKHFIILFFSSRFILPVSSFFSFYVSSRKWICGVESSSTLSAIRRNRALVCFRCLSAWELSST